MIICTEIIDERELNEQIIKNRIIAFNQTYFRNGPKARHKVQYQQVSVRPTSLSSEA